MLLGSLGLAAALLTLDNRVYLEQGDGRWLYAGGPHGAPTLLSTVAGSVITVAGVVFSITIAALPQASSQFGPRLLRNFMRDTANQLVLGTFVATLLYCILVLRAIPAGEHAVAPHVSVTVAVALAVASLLVNVIHHVSFSIQAHQVRSDGVGGARRLDCADLPAARGCRPAARRLKGSRVRSILCRPATAATCRRSTARH